MEYVKGQPLSERIRAGGRLPLEDALRITRDISMALDYAHEHGLVHRDVKSSNVMLEPLQAGDPGGAAFRAVLMDFGIAKILGGATHLTQTGMMGTLDYMAPEQIRASREVDPRADIYSLGVMLFEMLTGRLPFRSDNPGAVVLAHLQQPPPDPLGIAPDLPSQVRLVVSKAMAKNPAERYLTAGALADDLEMAVADEELD
jgi:serine/threonine protein kinase